MHEKQQLVLAIIKNVIWGLGGAIVGLLLYILSFLVSP